MGRTIPTLRMVVNHEAAKLQRFSTHLRQEDREVFQNMIEQCQLYASYASDMANPVPEIPLLLSIIFAQHKMILALEDRPVAMEDSSLDSRFSQSVTMQKGSNQDNLGTYNILPKRALGMRFAKREFVNEEVSLDGNEFIKCKFGTCRLIFSGALGTTMDGCEFKDCRWSFTGPAENTLKFLVALYHGGMKAEIEKTFENIRKGITASGSSLL